MGVKGYVPVAAQRLRKNNCSRCGISNEDAIKRDNNALNLHHRDGDRSNNTEENLLTLCAPCHTKEHWLKGKTAYRKNFQCYACAAEGIQRAAVKRGLCETCRTRARRHGSPFLRKRKIGKKWVLYDVRNGKRN